MLQCNLKKEAKSTSGSCRESSKKGTTWYCQNVKVNNAGAGFVCRLSFYTFKACLRSAARHTVNCFFLHFFPSFILLLLSHPTFLSKIMKDRTGKKRETTTTNCQLESEKVFEGIPGEVFIFSGLNRFLILAQKTCYESKSPN